MRGTVGCSKGVQLEVFGDPQGPSRGSFGGPNGVQLEVFREPQGGVQLEAFGGPEISWTSKLKFSVKTTHQACNGRLELRIKRREMIR
ncbi:hypothetical protein LSAT2_031947 [Lamellibrachia satsuma]|nr:hypothetical protein LSAT2_031947 [Lamellibrachia satsuma]